MDDFFFLFGSHFAYVALVYAAHLLTLGIEFLAKNSLRPALRAINETILTDNENGVGIEKRSNHEFLLMKLYDCQYSKFYDHTLTDSLPCDPTESH